METLQVETAQPEVSLASPEAIEQKFDGIVAEIDNAVAQAPELGEKLAATPLQKNTGMSDKPQAWR